MRVYKKASMGAELFHKDGQTGAKTGMRRLIVDFPKFADAPKNSFSGLRLF